jgi:hypothetical protein
MLTVKPQMRQNLAHRRDHRQCGNDKACLQVRSFVSGLPRREREKRAFVVTVQVAVDDSNRGQENQPAFILAGFMATVPSWESFVDDWQKELDREPSIRLLKASEAINLRKHFAGWSEDERDARLLSFVRIIRKYAFASIRNTLVKEQFDRTFVGFTGGLKKMYPQATIALITRTMHFAEKRKMRQPFEFIFDEGIMSPNQLRDMHDDAIKYLPPKIHRYISKFRHDTDDHFYPIQAADLFAGYYREQLVAETEGRTFESPVLTELMKIHCLDAPITQRHLDYVKRGVLDWNINHPNAR